jgi:uncharacterized protein
MGKKTVIIGATPDRSRYAFLAANMLHKYENEFVPVSIKTGEVLGKEILDLRKRPPIKDVDTVTLYIGTRRQPEWYDYILSLKPKRIIFNPGTENSELEKLAEDHGIETVVGCTLVMLGSRQF